MLTYLHCLLALVLLGWVYCCQFLCHCCLLAYCPLLVSPSYHFFCYQSSKFGGKMAVVVALSS